MKESIIKEKNTNIATLTSPTAGENLQSSPGNSHEKNHCAALTALAVAIALSLGTAPSGAAPSFTASGSLSSPMPNQSFPAGMQQNPQGYYARVPITSVNHYVQVTGGTPGGSLNVVYDLNIQSGATQEGTFLADDSYSGIVYYDANGTFTRQANGSGSLTGTATSANTGPGYYTASAVADIYNQADRTQKAHASSSAQWSVH